MRIEPIKIQSHKGTYQIVFGSLFDGVTTALEEGSRCYYIVDKNIAKLYQTELSAVLAAKNTVLIEATELNKSYNHVGTVIDSLLKLGIKRSDTVVALGGGIIQDITSFVTSILFRGLKWKFYPTTLLSQADSCMGSKSSINFLEYKNQVGTFNPPALIHISTEVLKTLGKQEIQSGIGEIIKIHLLGGSQHWSYIEKFYDNWLNINDHLTQAILSSLNLKRPYVEKDEFDQNIRLVLNYGHTFGHAIESATDFGIPHGIAVTIGMDMANYLSYKNSWITEEEFQRVHKILSKNYRGFERFKIPFVPFMSSISKDKKNTASHLMLILPKNRDNIERVPTTNDLFFEDVCKTYFSSIFPII